MINKSDLPKFDPDIYTKITLNELVIFSIHYLHAQNVEVTPEDIISACFMLFPKRFFLKKHPHWPDSAMVSRHWGVCRSKGYITAGTELGFKLTAKGARLAEKVAKALGMEVPKHAAKPARKVRPMERKEKTINPTAAKKIQRPRSKARVVIPTPKLRVMQKEKLTPPILTKKPSPPRPKARVVKQVMEAQPVQREKEALPAPIKRAHPVRPKEVTSAQKEKVVVIEQEEKVAPQPVVIKKEPTWAKVRDVKQAKEVRPAQKEEAPRPAPIKKARPARMRRVPFAKKEKIVVVAQKEKAILPPAAKKPRPPRSEQHPVTQAKAIRPVPRKTAPSKPVAHQPTPMRPAKLMKDARPIWAEKTKPPEPVVRPVTVKKAQPIQPEKIISPAQSIVTPEQKIRARKFVHLMEKSDVYIHYKKNGKNSKISEFDFRDLLLCTMESSPETLARNMNQFKGYASIHNRQDLLAFLNFCEEKHSHLLVPQTIRPAKLTRKQ